jgi:plasmid replication initiation protein
MKNKEDKSLYVVSSNDLVRAKYSYTLWEKRVFLYMVSQLKRDQTEFPMMRIAIRDLMRFYGTFGKGEYSVIRSVPENIIKKPFYIPYVTPDGERRWLFMSVISAGTQPDMGEKREESYIELQFNPVLAPHLMDLRERFTRYNIRNISELQSVYSIRMFEFIKENEFKKDGFEISVDDLKEMLFMKAQDNDGAEVYQLYADFKKRVLMKAQEDLNEHCDTTFIFEERKDGRRVTKIFFKPLKNQPLDENEPPLKAILPPADAVLSKNSDNYKAHEGVGEEATPLYAELLPDILALGISSEVLQLLAETQPEDALRNGLAYTQREVSAGRIRENVAGFFINAVKKRFTSPSFEQDKKQAQKKADREQRSVAADALQQKLNKLNEAYAEQVTDIIRELTTDNDATTERAIEAVKVENKAFFKSQKIDVATLTVADFRKDAALRSLVIDKIQHQNTDAFAEADQFYLPKIQKLQREIAALNT